MKLTGSLYNIKRGIAKRIGDTIEEKQTLTFNVSPATQMHDGNYGYGSLTFTIHGKDISDLGVTLGDKVEVIVHKEGYVYTSKELEDARYDLVALQEKFEKLETSFRNISADRDKARNQCGELTTQLTVMQREHIRLTTELLTLKQIFRPQDGPKLIDQE